MAHAKSCNVPVRFWSPQDQKFYVGTMTSYHDESMTANVSVRGGPTFWIVPFAMIRRID